MSRLALLTVFLAVCLYVNAGLLDTVGKPCKSCRKYCPSGFVLGDDGCPAGCECCPDAMCLMHCKYGFVKENGCDICKCACPLFMCLMYCENGFVKDENGCERCECA